MKNQMGLALIATVVMSIVFVLVSMMFAESLNSLVNDPTSTVSTNKTHTPCKTGVQCFVSGNPDSVWLVGK